MHLDMALDFTLDWGHPGKQIIMYSFTVREKTE
jgi:hypothetical protein